ncbi:MAG: ATP-binding protein [Candidatus Sericytochromatia bacterium]|nr:ATP-binding protein [Candidatus Sericytochromatia bacterium]
MPALHFLSDVDRVEVVRSFIEDTAASLVLTTDERYHLELAVLEAVMNVMVHAYGSEAGHPIRLSIDVDAEGVLRVEVRDKGTFFNILDLPAPDLQRHIEIQKRGGLGVHLMRNLMDDVNVLKEGDENILRMCKRLAVS